MSLVVTPVPPLKPIRIRPTREQYSNRLDRQIREIREDIIRRRAAGDLFPEFRELLRHGRYPSKSPPHLFQEFYYYLMYCVTPRTRRQYIPVKNENQARDYAYWDALTLEFARYRKDRYYEFVYQAKAAADNSRRVRPRIE